MTTTALADLGNTHLIGVGGAGMSVVARLLDAAGVAVSGSDARDGDALRGLQADGIRAVVGHDPMNLQDVDTVVVSSAVREDNVELAAARARGIRVVHRSEALAALMVDRRAVAVAGAHGKTTTTAMLATMLATLGLDPSFAVGGTVTTVGGPVAGGHLGTGDILVAEADESDGSFLAYSPTVSIVTNVEPDHLDHYGSREAFEQVFVDFAARLGRTGTLVACLDDDGSARLAAQHGSVGGRVLTYGQALGADVSVEIGAGAVGGRARIRAAGASADLRLSVPGVHNILNAAAAVGAALVLGVALEDAVRGVSAFRGTGRRFDLRGEAGGVRVVDDYAHHPTEVEALLRAARGVAGDGRVVVLFQPHLFSRTKAFAPEFARALALADEVVVTGVYAAREDPDPQVDASTIVRHMPSGSARAVEDKAAAVAAVAAASRPGDLVLTVGAGDVTELAPVLLDLLEEGTS